MPLLAPRSAGAVLAAVACLLLSGCIAAAIPIAAGAALVESRSDRDVPEAVTARSPSPSPSSQLAVASARSDMGVVATTLTALPPPDPGVARAVGTSAIGKLQTYVLNLVAMPGEGGTRTSAILNAASSLQVARAPCSVQPVAIFVDLDPGREAFDPLATGTPAPGLAEALAAVRQAGVRVVWFSRLGTSFAGAARTALAESGLDPMGSDELVLLETIDQRKQSVRDAVARRLCPIAMLGDDRADFDELFLYLKNPGAAVALETMVDDGWFLANPFTPTAPSLQPEPIP